jgi:hypothetical protein
MFYFRLNKVTILDNGAIKPLFGIFGHDFADVKFLSFVTPDNIDLPNLDAFKAATDPAERRSLLAAMVNDVVASRDLTDVSRVTDHAVLTFGDTGYLLYESPTMPESFNWTFMAIKSNQGFRDVGAHTQEVVNDDAFGSFADGLLTLITTGAGLVNPAYAAGIAVAKFATQVAAQNMARTGDKQLGLVYMSLDHAEHYPYGERKADDVMDLTNNMMVDYSIFAYERAIAVNP